MWRNYGVTRAVSYLEAGVLGVIWGVTWGVSHLIAGVLRHIESVEACVRLGKISHRCVYHMDGEEPRPGRTRRALAETRHDCSYRDRR